MKDYAKLAKEILTDVGGESNVVSVTNCMTRLRLVLKDPKKVNVNAIKNLPDVQTVIEKGGQTQVVIGPDVANVCAEFKKLGNFSDAAASSTKSDEKLIDRILGMITAIFQPIIPAICGSGMIKAILAICTAAGWLTTESQTYVFLNMFADAAFYFLPIYIGFSTSKKLNLNPYLGAMCCACLIHPTFTAMVAGGEPITLFAMPVKSVSYGSAVVPPILIVLALKFIDTYANKFTPDAIKVFMVPLIDFIIVCPLAFIILGPIGSYIGDLLYYFFAFLDNQARWLIPVMMGAFSPLLVMTGMHYSLVPVQLAQYATLGYGTLLGPGMLSSNLSQAGASFAVALRTRNANMKSTAVSAGTTALFGITEPALYGVTMKTKRPLWAVMISGGIAGLWGGLTNMRTYASASAGILALPVYVAGGMANVINAVICMVIALVCSFILTYFFFKPVEEVPLVEAASEPEPASEAPKTQNTSALTKYHSLYAPVEGDVVHLESVKDEVFSKKVMGDGTAIYPKSNTIRAPFDGKVSMVFPTGHAAGLTDENGVEVILHIGIDTVEMEGKGFKTLVKEGDTVKKGQPIIEVDFDAVKNAGYDPTTMVIVTNTADFLAICDTDQPFVQAGDELLKIFY